MFRKYKLSEFYENSLNEYYLLPFRFRKINTNKEILVNEVGDYLIVNTGTAKRIADKSLSKNDPLYPDLVSNFFISESHIPKLIDVLATKYRTKKSFLNNFTSLHIFVMTLRCNHSCKYCQVSRKNQDSNEYDISDSTIARSIELMFKSPSQDLTIEFQGGEPLLVFPKIKAAINTIEKINNEKNRNITYVLCTNLTSINREILKYCKTKNILISTSVDGPEFIHNLNRKYGNGGSYEAVRKGIILAEEYLGKDMISPLMTASNESLNYPLEIVNEYLNLGFKSIFLRQINPYGYSAKLRLENISYTQKFIEFYKKTLLYIIDLNKNGVFFVEEFATIILSKILTPFPIGFTDLQSPAGTITEVIVYNYDGNVYPSDEARMLAEEGNKEFCLGNVNENTYTEIYYGEKAHAVISSGVNETLAGCSECAFQPYCGADPIRNYATQGNMYGLRPTSSFCVKNMEIINFLFNLCYVDKKNELIFRSWINRREL